MAKTGRTSFQFMLRMPDGLRDALKRSAEDNGRSVTAEILERLEASFENWPTIRLPPEILSRADAALPIDRANFEIRLQSVVIDFAEREFPPREQDFFRFDHQFYKLLDLLDESSKEEAARDFAKLMRYILERSPPEVRETVRETVDYEDKDGGETSEPAR